MEEALNPQQQSLYRSVMLRVALPLVRGVAWPLDRIEEFRKLLTHTIYGRTGILGYWLAIGFLVWEFWTFRSSLITHARDILAVIYESSYAPWIIGVFVPLALVKMFFTYNRKLRNLMRAAEKRIVGV